MMRAILYCRRQIFSHHAHLVFFFFGLFFFFFFESTLKVEDTVRRHGYVGISIEPCLICALANVHRYTHSLTVTMAKKYSRKLILNKMVI